MPNVYYSPELFGLETIGEIEWDYQEYQFNLTVVFRDKLTGEFYVASDSGCSCPSPFEDFNAVCDLTVIGRTQDLIDYLEERRIEGSYYRSGNDEMRLSGEIGDLIMRVRGL